jgi:NADH-quinone oxidoreductase subunit C
VGDGAETIRRLLQHFPDAVVQSGEFRGQHWAQLTPGRLLEVCRWLRDDAAAAYDFLVDVTAAHWPEEREPVDVVYHLYSYARNDRLRLKVRTAEPAEVPSLTELWKSADWNEREAYDMFGVRFTGHPDLRRILMPDEYTDHPLRKEFPLYRG